MTLRLLLDRQLGLHAEGCDRNNLRHLVPVVQRLGEMQVGVEEHDVDARQVPRYEVCKDRIGLARRHGQPRAELRHRPAKYVVNVWFGSETVNFPLHDRAQDLRG